MLANPDEHVHPLETLDGRGWLVLPSGGENGVAQLIALLGPPLRTTQVRLDPTKGTYLTSPGAIPPHTDHPDIRWIAWRCVAQDDEDGASILVDLKQLDPEIAESARELKAPCPCLDSTRARTTHPVLWEGRWYYPTWHVQELSGSARLRAAVEALPSIEVRLKPDDILVVDNHRVLHGRCSIGARSKRHLVRYWFPESRIDNGCQCVDESAEPSTLGGSGR